MGALTLTLFGSPCLARNGVPLRLRSRKCLALLAYLAVTGRSHRREHLAALFWPESDGPHAQNSLRYTLSALRRALGSEWLLADREAIGLDGSEREAVDVVRFHELLRRCRSHGHAAGEPCVECLPLLEEAVELHQGDFMAGFTLRDAPEFDGWQTLEQEALQRELGSALGWLADGYAAQGEMARAVACAQRRLALDPLQEAAHRTLMRLYAGSGRRTEALRQFQSCESVLRRELGVGPSAETKELYEAVRGGRIPQSQVRPSLASRAATLPRHNLPVEPTRFVGREAELDQMARLLSDPACRLLTVVGPGGIGKTRLAIQTAEEQLPMFRDGVWFVPLASVASVGLLPSAIMEALDVPGSGGQDRQTQLLNYLRQRQLLLILDNFEHLLDGAGLLVELVRSAAGVKTLVTSRERLALRGEWLFPLQGMAVPQEGDVFAGAASELEAYSAVALFVQCAKQVKPQFTVASAGPDAVACICRLVEGMPLAIELAAPWVRVMGCRIIVREIEANLGFLATTLRDVPARHRSMRAVFDHSWKLLSAEERSVLRKLSVFRGGFRREAAEAVATRLGRSPASLLTLTALVDKSWLRLSPSGRYEMHELTRQYCEAKLLRDREASARVRDRHSDYYAGFLSQREPRLKARDQVEALESILMEMGNIRAAWDWATERGDVEALSRCVESLYWVGLRRGWQHEVMQSLGRAAERIRDDLDSEGSVEPALGGERKALLLSRILSFQAHLTLFFEGFGESSVSLCEESLGLLEGLVPSLEQQKACAFTKANLGWFVLARGDSSRARPLLEQALLQASEAGDQWTQGYILWILADIPRVSGHYEEGERHLRQGIEIFGRLGDRWMEAWCLNGLPSVLCAMGKYQEAMATAKELVQMRRQLRDPQGIDHATMRLGDVAVALGRYDEARQHYRDGLTLGQEYGNPFVRCLYLLGMGTVAAAQGQNAEAVRLLREAAVAARELGDLRNELLAVVRLGHAVFGLGDVREARKCFRQALEGAMEAAFVHWALAALVGIAQVSAHDRNQAHAVELLALALRHRATYHEDRVRAQELLAELATTLPPDAFAAALARGEARGLEEVAEELSLHNGSPETQLPAARAGPSCASDSA